MKIEFVAAEAAAGPKAAIAVLAGEGAPLAGAAALLDAATGGALQRAIDGGRFTGAKGQTLDLVAPHGVDAARVIVVGSGPAAKLRRPTPIEAAAAQAYQAVKTSGADTLVVKLPAIAAELAALGGVRRCASPPTGSTATARPRSRRRSRR